MTKARRLLRQYLEQRDRAGEGPFFTERELSRRPPAESSKVREVTPDEAVRAPAKPEKPSRMGTSWRDGAPPIPEPGITIPSPSSDLFSDDDVSQHDLDQLADVIRVCTRCRLCEDRTQAVPGEGPSDARLVLVGEGPGAKEDETGRPFVGRAGELLTKMLASIDLARESVFICNVVKCRPPGNRKPQQDEIDACMRYLFRQIDYIRPKVILALGGTAAESLLLSRQSLGSLRNRVHSFRGIPLVVTYHPAALLRNPNWKKPTWDDVRIARQLLDQ